MAVGVMALAAGAITSCARPRTGGDAEEAGVKRSEPSVPSPLFQISLAQWSLHRELYAAKLTNMDFPAAATDRFGINAVEYVNSFWKDKARNAAYVGELRKRCDDLGVRSVLIMCDGEGNLGDPDGAKRAKAVENHHQWVEAAKALGCHSVRVNAHSVGSPQEQQKLAADGLRRLCEFADPHGINVIVENHGGLSSNGAWLAGTIRLAGHPRCGTLPDFGNFKISEKESYDRYQGVAEMMPWARGVSAKSYDFDAEGNETTIDYRRMLRLVLDAGYRGHIGIEYEGSRLSEADGITATKRLLERLRAEFTSLARP
jgi:L-ribulose-5-phosphate 3-epimerase